MSRLSHLFDGSIRLSKLFDQLSRQSVWEYLTVYLYVKTVNPSTQNRAKLKRLILSFLFVYISLT